MNTYSRHQADLDNFPGDLVDDDQLRYAAMMSTMSGPQQAMAYLIACETQANQTPRNRGEPTPAQQRQRGYRSRRMRPHIRSNRQSNTGAWPDHSNGTRGPASAA